MPRLTNREYAVFSFVRQFWQDQLKSPTRKEIGQGFGFTAQAAHYYIKALCKKNFLTLGKGPRNIRIKKKHYRIQPLLLDTEV